MLIIALCTPRAQLGRQENVFPTDERIMQLRKLVQDFKVGKQVLLCSEYTKIFSCLLKSALRYQFSFYNNQDSWYIRIMGICLFLCLVLNGMEATYQTRTRTGPFIYSTWVHLQKAVNLAALLEELFSGQMTAKSLITFQTDLQ